MFPESYYKIYDPKKLKKTYTFFKVELFRQFLLATLWKSQKQRAKYFNGKKDGIPNLIEQSMKSEFGHLIPFVIICFLSVYLLVLGQTKLGICTFTINVIGNFYPIILQRYHRMRIQILSRRQQPKK